MKTTEEALQRIEALVYANTLPTAESLSQSNYDDLLDARDAEAFAGPWTEADAFATALFSKLPDEKRETARVDKIRAYVFKRVYQETQVSDLASYVSDDIDLILKHLLGNMQNGWVNGLWLFYQAAGIPNGRLDKHPGTLLELV